MDHIQSGLQAIIQDAVDKHLKKQVIELNKPTAQALKVMLAKLDKSQEDMKVFRAKCEQDVKALQLRIAFAENKPLSEITPKKAPAPAPPAASNTKLLKTIPEIIEIQESQPDDDAPTPPPSGWIKRRFDTPDNLQKVGLISSTKDSSYNLRSWSVAGKDYVSISPTKEWDSSYKIPKQSYIVRVDEESVTEKRIEDVRVIISRHMSNGGCMLYTHKFSGAQMRSVTKQRDKLEDARRVELWEMYLVLFSVEYREKNKKKNFRYRPNYQSVTSARACEVLEEIITARCIIIAEKLGMENKRSAIYAKLRDATDNEWENLMAKVEGRERASSTASEEMLCKMVPLHERKRKAPEDANKSPAKKKPSLREQFVAAGHPEVVFDSLHGKMTEEQLRALYKF